MQQKKFITSLASAAALLIVLAIVLHCVSPIITLAILKVLAVLIPAFAVLTFLLYKNILHSTAKSPKRFVAAFIGAVSIKLFACALFIGLYLYLGGEGRITVALATMAVYLVFNILLVRSLMSQMSKE
ncbi:MAG: hypothetical protein ACKVOR_12335 [Flavobacteriales bacterium]